MSPRSVCELYAMRILTSPSSEVSPSLPGWTKVGNLKQLPQIQEGVPGVGVLVLHVPG